MNRLITISIVSLLTVVMAQDVCAQRRASSARSTSQKGKGAGMAAAGQAGSAIPDSNTSKTAVGQPDDTGLKLSLDGTMNSLKKLLPETRISATVQGKDSSLLLRKSWSDTSASGCTLKSLFFYEVLLQANPASSSVESGQQIDRLNGEMRLPLDKLDPKSVELVEIREDRGGPLDKPIFALKFIGIRPVTYQLSTDRTQAEGIIRLMRHAAWLCSKPA